MNTMLQPCGTNHIPDQHALQFHGMEAAGSLKLRELSHKGFYRLCVKNSVYFVEHIITNESRPLPRGHCWSLELHDDCMFAYAETHDPIWVSSIMKTSLWASSEDRVLLYGKGLGEGGNDTKEWLDEFTNKLKVDIIELTLDHNGNCLGRPSVKVYVFALPREQAHVFWEVQSLGLLMGSGSVDVQQWLRQAMRRTWMPALERRFNVHPDHRIQGRVGMRTSDGGMDSCCHKTSLSTAALLLLVCHWMCSFTVEGQQQMACSVLRALLLHLP